MGAYHRRPGIVPVRLDMLDKDRDDLREMAKDKGRSIALFVRETMMELIDDWRNNRDKPGGELSGVFTYYPFPGRIRRNA